MWKSTISKQAIEKIATYVKLPESNIIWQGSMGVSHDEHRKHMDLNGGTNVGNDICTRKLWHDLTISEEMMGYTTNHMMLGCVWKWHVASKGYVLTENVLIWTYGLDRPCAQESVVLAVLGFAYGFVYNSCCQDSVRIWLGIRLGYTGKLWWANGLDLCSSRYRG